MVGPYDKVPKKKALRSLLDFLLKKGVKINVFFRCFFQGSSKGDFNISKILVREHSVEQALNLGCSARRYNFQDL